MSSDATSSAWRAEYDVVYSSSRDTDCQLFTDVYLPAHPAPLLLLFHGWHGERRSARHMAQVLAPYFVVVNVDMRGRGPSGGVPDVNGWELLDGIDAVNYVRRRYAEFIRDPETVYCLGGSGGGGNTYAAMAKFPHFFAAGVVLCGISDYALWYNGDRVGEFRDEMDVWLGVTPDQDPNAYRARSGLHLLPNLRAPLLIFHGVEDPRVPVVMARRYKAFAEELSKPVAYVELPGLGHDLRLPEYLSVVLSFFDDHRRSPHPEAQARWLVGGYIQIGNQRLELDSINDLTEVDCALDEQGRVRSVAAVDSYTGNIRVVPAYTTP
ncbi:MAG: alpha/beta hydrolase family protein [Limnochordia bacterium]|jgi:dipeptidyl aminopeptidase/acylaminoacyl peptidase